MREAQELTDTLEENLAVRSLGTTSVRAELVKVFSELVNNSAEHGMPQGGQPGHAFDAVTVDSGAGIRTALARNPAIPQPEPDAHAGFAPKTRFGTNLTKSCTKNRDA